MNAEKFYRKFGRKKCHEVAKAAGTTPEYFFQIVYGQRHPSRKLAARLEEASGGKMKAAELLLG